MIIPRLGFITLVLIALILASFALFEAPVSAYWESLMRSQTSLILIAIMVVGLLAADVLLPTPSSVISIAAAATFGFVVGSTLIFMGMSLCCLLGYFMGRSSHALAHTQLERQQGSERVINAWIRRWGAWTLLISRPIPVLAETSIIVAGLTKFPLRRFLLITLPANALIAILYSLSVSWVILPSS